MKNILILMLIAFVSCKNDTNDFYKFSIKGDQLRLPIRKPYELVSNFNSTAWYLNLRTPVNGSKQFVIDSFTIQNDSIFFLTDKICYSSSKGRIWLVITDKENFIVEDIHIDKLYSPASVYNNFKLNGNLPKEINVAK